MGKGDFAVELEDVGFVLGNGKRLLDGVSLRLPAGETLVLIGRSGSGKTTLLKSINALLRPTSGAIRVLGRDLADWDPIRLRRQVGYVIQETGLFPHFTVEANVGLVPRLLGWDEGRIRARVQELLRLVGLDPDLFGARRPGQLSGGQRQRVGVARALAADPPLLLMDEPFGALDPVTRAELQEEFRLLRDRLRKSIVFVTHDIREALALGDRIGLMSGGRLLRVSAAGDFFQTDEPEVAAYRKVFA
ncbi:MAG: ATP-binding cassette domain-containing protein [Acidobacteriota bacterium]|nr:ATP-binding cassette domain-containing protein [Acidobacteriota bacterium]